MDADRWIERIVQGDEGALDELVEAFYPEILRYCLWHAPTPTLAEDAAQETFLKAIRFFDRYVHRGKFKAFLYQIAAPIFSSDYQTGSDNILRCAKYGRTPLALAKIKATLTITSLMYLICMSIYPLVEGFAFGWDTLKTSVQLIWSASSLLPITIGQLMLLGAAVGLLAFLATVLCILFLSAVCKSVYASSSLSLLLCMLPILTYSLLPERIDLWVRSFLPDGGIGLANSFLYEVLFLNFLHLGDLSLWYPFALLLGSVLEIPLWLWASVHAYKRRHL